jgi:competence protein ComEC
MRVGAQFSATLERVLAAQKEAQQGAMYPWAPVCMAIGIGGYFALRQEPSQLLIWGVLALAGGLAALNWRLGFRAPLIGVALVALGFSLAALRAQSVAAPVLDWRYYGLVEGRIVGMDRSGSHAVRLTLDQVRLRDVRRDETPERVRVSLHGGGGDGLLPGQRIMTTAHLSPPQGAVEPGGFDFRRHAWFLRLGAVGYSRVPVLHADDPDLAQAGITRLRLRLSAAIQSALPPDIGGFAAAITTGDRSGVSPHILQDLRDSNLAHLLAISGLHMGLLVALVYGGLRAGIALVAPVALRWPIRKIAAGAAFVVSCGYLALSGGNVATERAFVMTSVMLLAVLLDRRALSLRAVATAALIVLTLRPESLLSPGFQMSFAATTALVAVFELLRPLSARWRGPVISTVLSSLIAGLATAPIGAAHFNALSHFGLLANVVSVPVMGALIMPSAIVAAALAPLGLEQIGLEGMRLGLTWILWVGQQVARLPGATSGVIAPGAETLPMLALGALWLAIWQGRWRLLGVIPVALAFWTWSHATRPEILIAENGSLVGVMTDQGRALSKAKGAGFVAQVWLENDGDGASQVAAADRWSDGSRVLRRIQASELEVIHAIGKRGAAELTVCPPGTLVVYSVEPDLIPPGCEAITPNTLRNNGSIAITGERVITARDLEGRRPWTPR